MRIHHCKSPLPGEKGRTKCSFWIFGLALVLPWDRGDRTGFPPECLPCLHQGLEVHRTWSNPMLLTGVSSSLAAETFGGCHLGTKRPCAIALSLIWGQATSGCSQCRRDWLFSAQDVQPHLSAAVLRKHRLTKLPPC